MRNATHLLHWARGSCSDSGSIDCAFVQYCGYHSYFSNYGQSIIYANLPYANSIGGCNYYAISPNSDDADSTITITSHEQMEAATDPEPYSGRFDSSYNEIGDKCAWTFGAIILDGNKFFTLDEFYCEKQAKLTYPPQRSQKTTSSNGLRPSGFGG